MAHEAFDGVRVLTFDVVGTLIDFESGILECLRPRARSAGVRVPDRDILESFGRAEDAQAHETPHLPFTQMLEPIYRRMAEELGLPDGDEHALALRSSLPVWPAFPDSRNALRTLGRQFTLVALTNADNWALAAMAATLGAPFTDTVTAEDAGANKPDPRVFQLCLDRLSRHGLGRESILHVAQSQYHDIGAAAALGWKTCWIQRRASGRGYGATPPPAALTRPDLHFTSLAELARAVAGR